MKSLLIAALLAGLAGCGGGSGGSGGPSVLPTVAPTATPKITYTVSIRATGGAMGITAQDFFRHPMAATPEPLQLTAPDSTDPLAAGGVGASGVNVNVVADVAPSPAAPPPATYTTTDPDVQVSPGPTPAPGSTDLQGANLRATKVNGATASSTFTAAVGGTVNVSTQRQLIVYPGMTLYATVGALSPTNEYPGYTVTAGKVTGTFDVGTADIWLDMGHSQIELPYGGTLISNATSFAAVAPAQWAATYQNVPFTLVNTRNADKSVNNIVVFKGADGTVCEYMVVSDGGGTGSANAFTNGPVQCHGTSINGF